MKQIKFRAFIKDIGVMCPAGALYFGRNYDLEGVSCHIPNGYVSTKNVADVYLMQSTGLKDKNGVEIFEGDIVNHYWSNEVGESFCHKTVIKNPFDYKVDEAMYLIYADELEILGNIYENSDLMEELN